MTNIKSLKELKRSNITRYEHTRTGEAKRIHTIDIRGKREDPKLVGSVVTIDEDGQSDEIDAQEFQNQLALEIIKPLPDTNSETSTLDSFENTPAGHA
ncbi:hypothetical protein [Halorubrum sp. AJ67]|uniref:hypothetical protein n=1 Tax=Halorubrum sp. AJ67 TaxID=1173487 RepID=UPI0003DBBF9B|nr:hypothetical protein [Halorubrum sp. AJ67]CDK38060.1 hypothetical protein BN903_260 [Halorubrum sp. AJ67]